MKKSKRTWLLLAAGLGAFQNIQRSWASQPTVAGIGVEIAHTGTALGRKMALLKLFIGRSPALLNRQRRMACQVV